MVTTHNVMSNERFLLEDTQDNVDRTNLMLELRKELETLKRKKSLRKWML